MALQQETATERPSQPYPTNQSLMDDSFSSRSTSQFDLPPQLPGRGFSSTTNPFGDTAFETSGFRATRAGRGASNNEHRLTAPQITRKSNRGPSDNGGNECFQGSQIRHEWFQPRIGPVLIPDGYTWDQRFQLMRMGISPPDGNHTSPSVQRQRLALIHQSTKQIGTKSGYRRLFLPTLSLKKRQVSTNPHYRIQRPHHQLETCTEKL
jgi:hypothetical protein